MKKRSKKVKKRAGNIMFLLSAIIVSCFCFKIITVFADRNSTEKNGNFIASTKSSIPLYSNNYEQIGTIPRGSEVETDGKEITNVESGKKYNKIIYEKQEYLIDSNQIVNKKEESVLEKKVYIRTPVTVYKNESDSKILSHISKGQEVEILGYDKLLDSGFVNKYRIKYNDIEGYIYGKYTVDNYDESMFNYDADNTYKIHQARVNTQGGGTAANLDFYPYEKAKFSDNIMPEEVRSLYMNAGVIYNVDKYIEIAKSANMNAIVVDIKDNTAPAYKSPVMEAYSPTNYNHAFASVEKYQNAIKKIKDAGLYAIGRITVFKDSYYATDHPENTIVDNRTGLSYNHNGSYWPSAYSRDVWEFNVELAKEAVTLMGFNEIQFDYVRFPDRTSREEEANLNFQNSYNEEKAQAIQNFLMYACDEIHTLNAYVSADVFGESAHNYVTGYGQYWGAISNVVDVISAMPYPDHFGKYEYGFKEPVWTVPYKLLNFWATNYVVKRQTEIPTPAMVRTWIQTYNTGRKPATEYGVENVSAEIQGLYEAGLKGGYMTWNAGSSTAKYELLIPAFQKNYGV